VTRAARYSGQTRGYVVQSVRDLPREDGTTFRHVAYWYGADHAWGTTSGPLDYSVAVYPSHGAAVKALDSVYGDYSTWFARGYRPIELRKVAP